MAKVIYNNITFDSELEVKYYKYLEEQKEKGEVLKFVYHPSYIMVNIKNKYTPDFIVEWSNKEIKVIETKGYNQFSFMRDNMIHEFMKELPEQVLINYICNNGFFCYGKKVSYQKIKYLSSFGFVDWDFKNPNTIANQRKAKITTQKAEIKELNDFKKNVERYYSYLRKIKNNEKLSKPQIEWKKKYELEQGI